MYNTEQRNGVLIFLAVEDHKFAILADEGINTVVPDNFWNDIAALMSNKFKEKDFVAGLSEGITLIGEKLKEFFPHQTDDINELSNEISFG